MEMVEKFYLETQKSVLGCSVSHYSCYIIKKQFHVHSAVFLQVHLVLLSWVLIQHCIILLTGFSSSQSCLFIGFWGKFPQIFWSFLALFRIRQSKNNDYLMCPIKFYGQNADQRFFNDAYLYRRRHPFLITYSSLILVMHRQPHTAIEDRP